MALWRFVNVILLLAALAAVAVVGAAGTAGAAAGLSATPVALVEEIAVPGTRVAIFDTLYQGERMELGEAGRVTLGYLQSCVQERILGGTVIVGREQSEVIDGKLLERTTVACAGGAMVLSRAQLQASGVVALRAPPKTSATLESNSRQPLIMTRKSPQLVLSRTDGPRERLTLESQCREDGRCLTDLAELGVTLEPGAIYRIQAGTHLVMLKVAATAPDPAGSQPVALLERLVIIHP